MLILIQAGYGIPMTNWIMSCVCSSSFANLLNREATDFFRSGIGLHQGCPLSPLLFILVMEGLSLLLKESKWDGKLMGVKVSIIIKILHLFFVDDVLIMTRDTLQEWMEVDRLIKFYLKCQDYR